MNISDATRKAMERYPYLEEYLRLGVINYRGLARAILGDIKQELGREVKIESVVSAIRRLPTRKIRGGKRGILEVLAGSEVNLKYDVGVITARVDSGSQKKIADLHRRIGGKETFQAIQVQKTMTIVVEESYIDTLKNIFGDDILDSHENLASIVVTSPEKIVETSGVLAHLASILAIEKINVVEMMSSYVETLFIVAEEDALKAIEVIRKEIKRARGQ